MSTGVSTGGRVRRPLRCGEPSRYSFTTADGVGLRLSRFRGGDKGPVILSPGYGTSELAYTLDTTETNFPEYLFEHGYDVWVFDYRSSPALPSASTQFTFDDVAQYDFPAAVATVRAETGADSVQLVAHCLSSLSMQMALCLGLQGVRSAVASQVSLHMRAGELNEFRSELHAANVLDLLGFDTLTTEVDDDPTFRDRMLTHLLGLYPAGAEPCDRPFCRRVNFMYGEVYDHDQLNEATHDHLHEAFGVANITAFEHVTAILRANHAVSADGTHDYLDDVSGLKLPLAFIHGEHNRMFLPAGTRETFEMLSERNGPEYYSYHLIPGYAHMDCFVGKDAVRDVYPVITAELDRHN
ncbi:MAG: hypothetical protein QM779_08805 [Propionicimonas sp.]|uniref:alpha/beta fold hydrolase n=1 Tax=Propionicimonas sp. TaxID=1955623 RepID=UPI003D0FCF74